MKKRMLVCLIPIFSTSIQAQYATLTFDSLNLPLDTFWNGSDLSGVYEEGLYQCYNQYDTNFGGYWAGGFAVSTMRDTVTGDFTNLYSAITGGGHNSDAYAVVSGSTPAGLEVTEDVFYWPVWMNFYITNTTYAYRSMENGDAFAKKFGGSSGNDPDYFFVRMRFDYFGQHDSIDIYLADFRPANNADDYILNDWVYIDLNDYPEMEFIGYNVTFQLYSSDTGAFGMNTPAFFSIDNLTFDVPRAVADEPTSRIFNTRARPDGFEVTGPRWMSYSLYDQSGRLITEMRGASGLLNTETLPLGIYVITATDGQNTWTQRVFRW